MIFGSSIIIGCKDKNEGISTSNLKSIDFPTIIDDFDFYEEKKMNAEWLNTANYRIYYIGKLTDSIPIDYYFKWGFLGPVYEPAFLINDTFEIQERYHEERIPYQPYILDWTDPNSSRNFIPVDQAKLEITIDTNQFVFNDENLAYPVIIKNIDEDSVHIAYGDFVPIIMEAINAEGNWKPIEEPWTYMCGNGVGSILLPPNEIVLTSAYKYHGKYKTLMRLKIGENYSNTFLGLVNERQFESIYDEHGEYKPEVSR